MNKNTSETNNILKKIIRDYQIGEMIIYIAVGIFLIITILNVNW